MHNSCGWNWNYNLPCFMRRIQDEDITEEKNKLRIYTKEEV